MTAEALPPSSPAKRLLKTVVGLAVAAALVVAVVHLTQGHSRPPAPPEVRLGERLFRETRFAHPSAARGSAAPTSCASCHLSDERVGKPDGGMRSFCDFAERSPLAPREDGRTYTVRNAPALVDAAPPRAGAAFFHYDGQFGSVEELAAATLTGRSLGWLPRERAEAAAQVARVLREDQGKDENATEHGGGTYAQVLSGEGGAGGAPIAARFRVDLKTASDEQALEAVARLIGHYVRSLSCGDDGTSARPFRSPYDAFVEKNGLPQRPEPGETDLAYARRLRAALVLLKSPADVGPSDGSFRTHARAYRFGDDERRGLVVFLTEAPEHPTRTTGVSPGGVGTCISCHAPPSFTDFGFHNVGASQVEYDEVHGLGAFAKLLVPTLAERNAHPDLYLPPSAAHPDAKGTFLSAPYRAEPERADLGLWNTFGNPDVPGPQAPLRDAIAARLKVPPTTPDADLLPKTIGWMKTPSLRNLGHSAPYFHGGHLATIEEAIQHYRSVGFSARGGQVRNAAPELAGIDLALQDILSLAAFLRALDEDPP